MEFRNLFLVAKKRPGVTGPTIAAAGANGSEGVFLSSKSLMSFPVASGAVTIVWKLLQHFWKVGDVAVLYIALIVGAVVFLIVVSDQNARPSGIIKWIVSVLIAVLNSLLLAASALGLVKNVFG